MAVKAIGAVIPVAKRVSKSVPQVKPQEQRKVINSFEFHAGFIPNPRPSYEDKLGHQARVEHFINSLI